MSAEEVLVELKAKAQPTYGTNQEKKDRLKKLNGNLSIIHQIQVLMGKRWVIRI